MHTSLLHKACAHGDLLRCFGFFPGMGGAGAWSLALGCNCRCAIHMYFLQFDPKHMIVPKGFCISKLHLNGAQIKTPELEMGIP